MNETITQKQTVKMNPTAGVPKYTDYNWGFDIPPENGKSDLEDIERITKAFMQVVKDIPEKHHIELMDVIKDFAEALKNPSFQDLEKSRLEEIKSRYKPFSEDQKITVKNILKHFKNQLGSDLKYFGAQEDNIYLDELRKIDPLTEKMYQKLYQENKKDKSSPQMKDFISKKYEKTTKRLNSFKKTDQTTAKEYHYIASVKQERRSSKKTDQTAAKEYHYTASVKQEDSHLNIPL